MIEWGVRWAYESGETFEQCGYAESGARSMVAAGDRGFYPKPIAVVRRECGPWGLADPAEPEGK